MSALTYDGYPVVPQGKDSERFLDNTVTPETSFRRQTRVKYDGGQAMPETTLLFEEPDDGFIIGITSDHKHAGYFANYIIRTDKASYYGDPDTFARHELLNDGSGKGEIKAYNATTLGDGISGRIGGNITLPGANR